MAAKAKTFWLDQQIEVDLLTGPTDTGLCKVAFGQRVFTRHVLRLEPSNEQGRMFLKRAKEIFTPV